MTALVFRLVSSWKRKKKKISFNALSSAFCSSLRDQFATADLRSYLNSSFKLFRNKPFAMLVKVFRKTFLFACLNLLSASKNVCVFFFIFTQVSQILHSLVCRSMLAETGVRCLQEPLNGYEMCEWRISLIVSA